MISTPGRGALRGPRESAAPLRALAASPALIVLLLAGLVLRLTIAYVLFPAAGFETDLVSYGSWALTLAEHGPGGFYANAGFVDYPPGYLTLLWPVGLVMRSLADAGGGVPFDLVKIPAMLIDIVVGYVLYRLVLGWVWPGPRAERMALAAAALYVLDPVTFYDSALWGQTDAVGALVLLLGVAALVRGNSEGAAALAVLAALVKPQFGVVLIPLVGVVLLKRHLVRPGSGPRHAPWAPRGLAAWLASSQGPSRLVTSTLVALAVFHLVALPFGMGLDGYVGLVSGAAGGYAYLSVNAFNAWALVGSGGTPPLAQSLLWADDTAPLVGPVPAVAVGAALLAGGYLWAVVRAAVRDDRWTLIVAAAALCLFFFALPTRVHERYVFPAVAILPLLAVADRRWLVALVALIVGAFVNLHGVLTIPLYATQALEGLPYGELSRSPALITLSAVLQTGVAAWVAWQLRPSLRTAPDAFSAAQAELAPTEAGVGTSAQGAAIPVDGVPGSAPAAGWAVTGERSLGHAGRRPQAVRRLASALRLRPSLRRDRSIELSGEGPGRLDRLDLLALLLIVVAATALRGFRLDQPREMYFDEVYHARTATEFLQHWRYGQPHAIYEYTHPHLAKYAIAAGIELAGGNHVTDTSSLGVPVASVALERRWGTGIDPSPRRGDRLLVATGSELRVYDLTTRELEAIVPGATVAVAVDEADHVAYAAGLGGDVGALETARLDASRGSGAAPPGLEPFGDLGPLDTLELAVTGVSLVARGDGGELVALDLVSGAEAGRARIPGANALLRLPDADRLVLDTARVEGARPTAMLLADILGADPEDLEERLRREQERVVVAAWLDTAVRDELTALIDEGSLPGAVVERGALLAVAASDGIRVLDALTLDEVGAVPMEGPVTGLASDGAGEARVFATSGDRLWVGRVEDSGILEDAVIDMPGSVSRPLWNDPAGLLHVVGEAPDGAATVYVVEPNGNAVFADARLAQPPAFALMDTQPERPDGDRGQLLAITPTGEMAAIGVAGNAFGWRIPGVLMGALTAACLYLLARLLFRRRSIAALAGLLAIAEGMLFANSRIAMNDVYVTGFILAATAVFAPLYLGVARRPLAVGLGLVATGLLLGLALASKWVALYAIGGLVLLVLLRSALGRWLALAGMMALTSVLGALAVRAPDVEDPHRNWLFLLVSMGLTASLAAAMVRRPLRMTRHELRFLVLGLMVGGAAVAGLGLAALGGMLETDGLAGLAPPDGAAPIGSGLPASLLLAIGLLLFLAGPLVLGVASAMARRGGGPLAAPALDAAVIPADATGLRPDGGVREVEPAAAAPDPTVAPRSWLRPGRRLGLPWLFALACLGLLPIAVYVASYAPWVALGNQWIEGVPDGNGGQTLLELTRSMYRYHDELRASHAASSPWWAWPLDLKPVWFYQEGFAGDTTGLIYDTGNLVVLWLGVPALAFAAWAAWRRRSLALAIVVIIFACLWLPWSRIDRATFQYHLYASLPFMVMALAYLLAELWHGPGPRSWLLARVAAAFAIVLAPILWLLRMPLCALAGTATANPSGVACGSLTRSVAVSEAAFASLLVVSVAGALVLWLVRPGTRSGAQGYADRSARLAGLLITALGALAGVVAAHVLLGAVGAGGSFVVSLTAEQVALGALLALALPAIAVLRARDPRRVVIGVVGAAFLWLLAWYPNLTGLPVPSAFAHAWQGLLPTWNYDFQFAVNLDPAVAGGFVDASTIVVGVSVVAFTAGVAWVARAWGPDVRRVTGRVSGDP